MRNRALHAAVATIVAMALALTLVAGAAAPVAAQENTTATPTPTPTPVPESGDSAPANDSSSVPSTAEQVRINPVKFQADYLNVVVQEEDTAFNTTGEFAVFTLSHRVDAVRINQQPAEAQVLEGGQSVKVEYQPDAAPPGETSLYQLELFFADGSSKTVELYASQTDQSVAAARLQEWEPVIDELCDLAEGHGYECNPESVEEYLTWVNDRADLVEGFLTRQVARTLAWVVAGVMNPLVIVLSLLAIAGGAAYWQRKHGSLLEALQRMGNRYQAKLDRLQIDHEKAKRTADDDALADVPAIGSTWAPYWEDAFGVKSPLQLARLASGGGARSTEDGLKQLHDGVYDDDFQAGKLSDSWLEPVLRHVGREQVALNHLLRTFEYIENEHSVGHEFRDARNRVEDVLSQAETLEEYPTRSGGTLGTGDITGAAGDD